MQIANGKIKTVKDWRQVAPPKRPDRQWVEGRSAYELAFAWCGSGDPCVPVELSALFDSNEATRGLTIESVTPEHRIAFDNHRGEPRNADIAFVGHSNGRRVAVTIEAKADEPFGETVERALSVAMDRLDDNPNSHGIKRIDGLVSALFSPRVGGQPRLSGLRYQLLTATAGTLAYAAENEAAMAVFVVHEFITDKTKDARHADNARDYEEFVRRLGGSTANGAFVGPVIVPGGLLFENPVPLLIGKIVTNRRSAASG